MAEIPVNIADLEHVEDVGDNDISEYHCNKDTSDLPLEVCVKLPLEESLAAYYNKHELVRETETLKCDNNLIDKVISNYVIVKQIISHLSWQEKLVCKHVCTTWNSAVSTLRKEQLSPEDFVFDYFTHTFKKSGNFYTEPLVALTFVNIKGFSVGCSCSDIIPSLCTPPCDKDHCLIDLVQRHVSAPKPCMLSARASFLSYLPLRKSVTYAHKITRAAKKSYPFVGGVYIPAIPDVEFHGINIKPNCDLKTVFHKVVDDLVQDRIIKGVIVYVTEKHILDSVEDIVFLNYFKEVQPDIPYALGGCIVEDAISEQSDIDYIIEGINSSNDYASENLISVGIFTVKKNTHNDEAEKYNFDMYSLVIQSSDWSKSKIEQAINEFSRNVPRFEHSVVMKLSCVGRDTKHEQEQDSFRTAFPRTRLIGCYGNGELGINHPPRPPPKQTVKRSRASDSESQSGIMYSYSTVFVYIGWGKITSTKGPEKEVCEEDTKPRKGKRRAIAARSFD